MEPTHHDCADSPSAEVTVSSSGLNLGSDKIFSYIFWNLGHVCESSILCRTTTVLMTLRCNSLWRSFSWGDAFSLGFLQSTEYSESEIASKTYVRLCVLCSCTCVRCNRVRVCTLPRKFAIHERSFASTRTCIACEAKSPSISRFPRKGRRNKTS
jgi:hypothetical protein